MQTLPIRHYQNALNCGINSTFNAEGKREDVLSRAHQHGGWAVLKDKRHLGFLCVLIFFLFSFFAPRVWPSFPEKRLTARAAFLMDGATGHVLYEKGPDLPLPPASTTKVLTAIVALENKKLDDYLRVTKSATRVPSLRMGLRPGQTMSLRDLLLGALLYSANDASVVLAEGIAGSVSAFARVMTIKAHQIGATKSRFTNPHGLTDRGHYSTARDMALIFNYAMRNRDFREIVRTKRTFVRAIYPGKTRKVRRIPLRNKNRLLWSFDGAIGGKTGYTRAARRCFVGGVSRNGVTLIVSVLGSRDLWGDTRKLLEYGFQNHKNLTAVSERSASPSPDGQLVTSQEKPSSPLFSWEEERRVRSSNGYILQIASFRERDRAESLQRWIIEEGYKGYMERASLDNGEITYRVRVGPYSQLIHAQEAAREIGSKSGFRAIIIPASLSAGPAEKPN